MAESTQNNDDVEALSAVLEQLDTQPNNVALIRQQISLMNKLAMIPEVLDATLRLASLVMLSEGACRATKSRSAHARSMAQLHRPVDQQLAPALDPGRVRRDPGALRASRAGLPL